MASRAPVPFACFVFGGERWRILLRILRRLRSPSRARAFSFSSPAEDAGGAGRSRRDEPRGRYIFGFGLEKKAGERARVAAGSRREVFVHLVLGLSVTPSGDV